MVKNLLSVPFARVDLLKLTNLAARLRTYNGERAFEKLTLAKTLYKCTFFYIKRHKRQDKILVSFCFFLF